MAEGYNLVIIGAGKGGTTLLNAFKAEEKINLLGIVDNNPNAPGLQLAKESNIPVFEDWRQFAQDENVDHIIDATGDPKLYDQILREKSEHVNLISGASIKLMWYLVDKHQQMEKELLREENFVRSILDSMPGVVYILDENKKLFGWNKAFADTTGYSAQELGTMKIVDFFKGEDAVNISKAIQEIFDKGQATTEVSLVSKDGSRMPYFFTGKRVFIEGKNLAVNTGVSATERKHFERIKLFLASIVESSDDAIIGLALDGKILSWNNGAKKIFGYSSEETSGKYISMLMSSENIYELSLLLSMIRDGVSVKEFATVCITKKGTKADVDLTASCIRDSSGEIIGASVIAKDITERRRMEKENKYNYDVQKVISSLLRISLEEIPLNVILMKAIDVVLSMSLFSFESKACIFFVDEDSHTLIMAAQKGLSDKIRTECRQIGFGECICGEAALRREIQFVRTITKQHKRLKNLAPHGHYCVPIMYAGILLGVFNLYVKENHTPNDKEQEFLMTVANTLAGVIRRKKTEELLFNSNINLEKTLVELKNTQKVVIQRECLAAVGQLAAGVAHDFNNLLSTIIGTAEIQSLRNDIPDDVRIHFTTIIDQGFKAAELVGQIMDFSRQSVSEMKSINLVTCVAKVITLLRRTIPERIELVFEHDTAQNCLINADETQLQQIMINLAINARDAMPKSGRIIFSIVEFILQEGVPVPYPNMSYGKWWLLKISDTGEGIDAAILPKIFDPFFSTKKEEGTGLGLSQVYGLVKKHNGFITAESKKGKGTTFNIYLPAFIKKEDVAKEQKRDEISKGKGQTILLVEDSIPLLKVTEQMVQKLGYNTLTAYDGKEALKVYKKHKNEISLVLTDMVMPGMDGAILFKELKQQDPNLPVVITTGYPGRAEGKKILEEGVVDWLYKPVHLDKLAEVINKAIKRQTEKKDI